ncbi:hypothetical protein [Streptomyces sp. NBC_00140]|uniref:hypothetical protein n=1 Tax=Streptomyces sp. NBC_00140 TaxID=2975664 RepID=UPI0022525E8F|nr:hypothetical protein [Streptomyces sp. NBC_00140]
MRIDQRVLLKCASIWSGFGISPFRRLIRAVVVVSVLLIVPLFVIVWVTSGYAAAYGVFLGLASGFGDEVRAGWPRGVAAALGVMGWIVVPTVIGVAASEMFTRRLGALKDLSSDDVDALMAAAFTGSDGEGSQDQEEGR